MSKQASEFVGSIPEYYDSGQDSQKWLDELKRLGSEDAYFFCVNRFLFSAVKI